MDIISILKSYTPNDYQNILNLMKKYGYITDGRVHQIKVRVHSTNVTVNGIRRDDVLYDYKTHTYYKYTQGIIFNRHFKFFDRLWDNAPKNIIRCWTIHNHWCYPFRGYYNYMRTILNDDWRRNPNDVLSSVLKDAKYDLAKTNLDKPMSHLI